VTQPAPRRPHLELSPRRLASGLALYEKSASGEPKGSVVCVHGSLDRARSFARVARRLEAFDVLAYDRRGYQGSRAMGASEDLARHAEDLLEVVELAAARGPATIFGHSLGGAIALTAAVRAPSSMELVVAYETPLRWLGELGPDWWVPAESPELEAERFFTMMTSPGSWGHLSEEERSGRRADGPALVADLRMVRRQPPFSLDDLAALSVPLCMALGSKSELAAYAASAELVCRAAPRAFMMSVEGAQHGAHLSHPDGVARMLEAAMARALGEEHAVS
jgi:pimeloyl-ACP methyl ester carboxylesterase